MNFIKKKDTPMSLFNQTLSVAVCPCVSTTNNPKEMGHQELGITRIIGTIEANKRRICWKCM
jgi:hypothetical protein